ncbi:hypothetical protein PR048_009149, partial [Dryococelus australis]
MDEKISPIKENTVHSDPNEESEECLCMCIGLGEVWVSCYKCKRWAHEDCIQGMIYSLYAAVITVTAI